MKKAHYEVVLDVFVESDDDFDPTEFVKEACGSFDKGMDMEHLLAEEENKNIQSFDIRSVVCNCTDSR